MSSRSRRPTSAGRWLAVLVLGFMVGAAVVLYSDAGTDSGATPVASAPGDTADATSDASVTDLNGHHVHGVKADDVAAESEPGQPIDVATREQLQQQLVVARDTAMRYPTVADAEAAGVFSHENPNLRCADGTFDTDAVGKCQGT